MIEFRQGYTAPPPWRCKFSCRLCRMGSAVSSAGVGNEKLILQEVHRQKGLPLDCSDILDLAQAKQEILRIRSICHKLPSDDQSPKNQNHRASTSTASSLASSVDQIAPALIREIKLKITERFENLQDAFLSVDTNRDGFISRQEFKEVGSFLSILPYPITRHVGVGASLSMILISIRSMSSILIKRRILLLIVGSIIWNLLQC
jgi:hypothetical protein